MEQAIVETAQFSDVLKIWSESLWPGRVSPIEPVSIIGIDGELHGEILQEKPIFWMVKQHGNIIAVSSGFKTSAESFRIRGTWVSDALRGQGLGRLLLEHAADIARQGGAKTLWTMPRMSAWPFYQKIGFKALREVTQYEFGPHYIAEKSL